MKTVKKNGAFIVKLVAFPLAVLMVCFCTLTAYAYTSGQIATGTDVQSNAPLTTAAAGSGYTEIAGAALPSGVESITTSVLDETTNKTYPWTIYNDNAVVFCSGNKGKDNSVSTLKVTVKGSGALVYEYKVFSTDSTQEDQPDSLLVSVGTEITKSTSYTGFTGDRFYSSAETQDYTRKVVKITAEENELTDVYFTYKKNGKENGTKDFALLTGIQFNSGSATVIATVTDETLGTVSGSGTYYAGDEVILTVTPNDGAVFCGWSANGVLQTGETATTYKFIAGADVTVRALLGTSATIAQNRTTGEVYSDLADALAAAQSGQTIELVNNAALDSDAVIKEGVTLYIPYDGSHDADGNADGTTNDAGSAFAAAAKTYCKLTVAEGVTLDVRGNLLVGGVISYPGQQYSGHTSGAHGRITNNGAITVNGGRIDCYGFIDGAGSVTANTGFVYEPFVVYDFSGGSNTLDLYGAGQNPFTQYTMQNISCALTVKDTAAYGVYCNLYASSAYNKTDAILIGGSATAPRAMIQLSDGAYVTRTVDKTKSVSGGTASGTYGADIYKTIYTVDGGASLNNMAMTIYGVDVSVKQYPIPYSFRYVLTNGDYSMPNGWSLLPGAEMTVAQDATLTSGGKLYVLDGLISTGMSGKYYPSSEKLAAAGFPTNGVLTVDGTLTLQSGSAFGGIVQTNGTGTIVIEDNVTLSNSVQVGAAAYYDDNTCIVFLPGRAYVNSTETQLIAGTTYEAVDGNAWTLPGYTVTSYAKTKTTTQPTSGTYKTCGNGKTYAVYAGPETVVTNQSMVGAFKMKETVEGFTVINKTCYDDGDHSRTAVSEPVAAGSSATFTVSRTADGENYNYLVKVSVAGGDAQTVTPDADGTYTVTGINGAVVITVISVKKGDVNGDGYVDSSDSLKVLYYATGKETPNELQAIAADVNNDGYRDSADALQITYFATGRITKF